MTGTAAAEEATARWSDELRAHGRRVTKQRLAVLRAVDAAPHSVADDVVVGVRRELPDISLQSIYVVLADLTETGLLRKIETPDSPARYETRVNDNHHHAICTGCGRIEDVDCAVGHAPCLTPGNTHGMTIQIADVLYRGLCTDCAAAAAS
ncbi:MULTISPECIES: transcriptional repressor [unclassified Arthrobacter]|uniref:Fur family transcriptional regulator n=1 Tax=unclassified Arthrobacter TaxID=235627 RepID=UPI001E3454A0|nr:MULTISPECIES: transcriptional repressor [unclassified Arthrobacter]MCC9144818.1 transcriptional repressor [Arthrobacter sp. zg-Y919]MDK1276044.1 transcriptional repressor [Arthrobacter sp. zg.Y919]WIB02610.1 transcriptional repressor [Arthrobacter sp. zg-Y919]